MGNLFVIIYQFWRHCPIICHHVHFTCFPQRFVAVRFFNFTVVAHGHFLYHTNCCLLQALAQDQLRALLAMLNEFDCSINIGVYDGDTSQKERTWLRDNARLVRLKVLAALNVWSFPSPTLSWLFSYLLSDILVILYAVDHKSRYVTHVNPAIT